MSTIADVLIVGGGSAGAVLTSPLSEDPGRQVLLLEAGRAYLAGEIPPVLTDEARIGGDPEHDWGYKPDDLAALMTGSHSSTTVRFRTVR